LVPELSDQRLLGNIIFIVLPEESTTMGTETRYPILDEHAGYRVGLPNLLYSVANWQRRKSPLIASGPYCDSDIVVGIDYAV
jgi:hypothetical protein